VRAERPGQQSWNQPPVIAVRQRFPNPVSAHVAHGQISETAAGGQPDPDDKQAASGDGATVAADAELNCVTSGAATHRGDPP
jgi:hypothetical protein